MQLGERCFVLSSHLPCPVPTTVITLVYNIMIYTCYVEGTKMFVNKTVNITVSEGIHTSMYACIRLYLVHTYTV